MAINLYDKKEIAEFRSSATKQLSKEELTEYLNNILEKE